MGELRSWCSSCPSQCKVRPESPTYSRSGGVQTRMATTTDVRLLLNPRRLREMQEQTLHQLVVYRYPHVYIYIWRTEGNTRYRPCGQCEIDFPDGIRMLCNHMCDNNDTLSDKKKCRESEH